MLEKVFVYGSLRSNMYNYHKYLENKVISSKIGRVKGELYKIDGKGYPALLDGDEMIYGEVFEFNDFIETMKLLDELEEYEEDDIENSMYIRDVMTISLENGDYDMAYVYRYNKDSYKNKDNKLIKVDCNDWIEYMGG